MSDNNHQQLLLSYDLEEQFCEDLSAEEIKAVQGGLTDVYRRPIHPSPIDPAPKPIEGVITVHPRPLPIKKGLFTGKPSDTMFVHPTPDPSYPFDSIIVIDTKASH